jgi:hypothetical protein
LDNVPNVASTRQRRGSGLTRIIHEGWRRIRGAVGVAQAFERA